jgi:hypothetical protein
VSDLAPLSGCNRAGLFADMVRLQTTLSLAFRTPRTRHSTQSPLSIRLHASTTPVLISWTRYTSGQTGRVSNTFSG